MSWRKHREARLLRAAPIFLDFKHNSPSIAVIATGGAGLQACGQIAKKSGALAPENARK
jgi:hypothetical protein